MDARYAAALADDLDIPLAGQERSTVGRRAGRISNGRHRAAALKAPFLGHAVFEMVAEIEDGIARLRKLATRPQHTIGRWTVDRNGDWTGIEQAGGWPPIQIPRSKLLVYTYGDDTDGQPTGRPLLRALYRHWLLKDKLMRISAMAHERHGVGYAKVTVTDPGMGQPRLNEAVGIASQVQAGTRTSVGMPPGTDMSMEGLNGSTTSPIDDARYHDEQMARGVLAQVMQLGQTQSGSRALGEVQMDHLGMFVKSLVDWEAETVTEQVVEPFSMWNGLGDTGAWVGAEKVDDAPPSVDELVSLINAQVLTVDDELETWARSRMNLPVLAGPSVRATTEQPPAPLEPDAAFAAGDNLPARELRRPLTPAEQAAKVNPREIDEAHDTFGAQIAAILLALRTGLVERAAALIASARDVKAPEFADALNDALSAEVSADTQADLAAALEQAAQQGLAHVVGEAARQGAPIAPSVDYAQDAVVLATLIAGNTARGVATAAATEAQRLASPDDPSGAPVASAVKDAISKPPRNVEDDAYGAASEALFRGEVAAMREQEQAIDSFFAMELLDTNTCGPCAEVDGRDYESLDDALVDYPTGKYRACEGRNRCRGRIVALFKSQGDLD
jgi:hypothetical protein